MNEVHKCRFLNKTSKYLHQSGFMGIIFIKDIRCALDMNTEPIHCRLNYCYSRLRSCRLAEEDFSYPQRTSTEQKEVTTLHTACVLCITTQNSLFLIFFFKHLSSPQRSRNLACNCNHSILTNCSLNNPENIATHQQYTKTLEAPTAASMLHQPMHSAVTNRVSLFLQWNELSQHA